MTHTETLTELLHKWGNGDQAAFQRLMPLVYDELHRRAEFFLRKERHHHTIQPTALVNEAYLRLSAQRQVQWQDRQHFFRIAANMMRRFLVDYARQYHAAKRQRDQFQLSLDDGIDVSVERAAELIALDDALATLHDLDAQKAQIVELRFFGGLSVEETAEVLQIAPITVMRHWRAAKAWLYRELRGEQHE